MKIILSEFEWLQGKTNSNDVETLLISGNVDFSTPAEFTTDDLLPPLTNGTQVILSEMGHVNDVMSVQSEAIERLLTSFFDSGEADDSLFVYEPMDFQVGRGFPQLAKLGWFGLLCDAYDTRERNNYNKARHRLLCSAVKSQSMQLTKRSSMMASNPNNKKMKRLKQT